MVLISHTGRTKSQVELAQLARENDAMVIALTTAGTPLAREATLAITLDVPEDTDMPMVSRLAQLTVIDVLATTSFYLRRELLKIQGISGHQSGTQGIAF